MPTMAIKERLALEDELNLYKVMLASEIICLEDSHLLSMVKELRLSEKEEPLPDKKPCPIGCGSIAVRKVKKRTRTGHKIGYNCTCHCGWKGPTRNTKKGAVIAWNQRTKSQPAK